MRGITLENIGKKDLMPETCYPVDIGAIAPALVSFTYAPDHTPTNIVSFAFYKFEEMQPLSFLQMMQESRDDVTAVFPNLIKRTYAEHLGDTLATLNLMNAEDPDFLKDAEIISRHCFISDRPPHKGENTHAVKNFVVNGKAVYSEDPRTWSRFLKTTENKFCYRYFKNSDIPRDIVVPRNNT